LKTRLDPQPLSRSTDEAEAKSARVEPRLDVSRAETTPHNLRAIPRKVRLTPRLPVPPPERRIRPERMVEPGVIELAADPRARLLRRSRNDENLIAPVTVSLLVHALMAVALLVHVTPRLQEPPTASSVAVVWQPPSNKLSAPQSSKYKIMPRGASQPAHQAHNAPAPPPPSAPPPNPSTEQQPEHEATQAPEAPSKNSEQAEATKKSTPSPTRETHHQSQREATHTPPSQDLDHAFTRMTNLNLSVPNSVVPLLPGQSQPAMPGPAPPGHASMGHSVSSLDAPGASDDWAARMSAWVNEHDYYPDEAIRKHEEGTATVEVTIDKDGKILDLELVGRSGSRALDDAWQSIYRNHMRVPAPTPDMDTSNGFTFRASLQYVLIDE
jgi:protein TonB